MNFPDDNVEIIIFDMDGTLYQFDGINNGYSGSKLERLVIGNTLEYVLKKERCTRERATQIIDEGLNDSIGLSNYLGKRYGTSRDDYFNIVWNISPDGIVKNYEVSIELVRHLVSINKRLFLLTSSPKVWQRRVFEFIGFAGSFERIYTGEQYTQKEEVFVALCNEFEPSTLLSIGDQMHSDIKPADLLGMHTYLVNSPNDLKSLLSKFS